MKLNELTAHEALAAFKAKTTTPKALLETVKNAINRTEKKVNAFAHLDEIPYNSKEDAKAPIPIAIKDNICIKDYPTTCASHILKNFKPLYDATVISKLRESGANFLGHSNMDEFAFGSSTETSHFGPTKNPWNLDCVPGGSSGGSAAAVAANETIWALGSDTGGSIRQPASFCGVVGLKPTYGLVSRYGLIAFASSLDQIGPFTKDVEDCALLLNLIAGHDEYDSTSAKIEIPDYTKSLINDAKGLKIAIPKEYFIEGISPDVKASVDEAIALLKKKGATFTEISMPHTEYAVATYYILATAEASSNLARFDGIQYGLRSLPKEQRKTSLIDLYEETRNQGFGQEAKRRIMLGTYSLSAGYYDAYYLRAQKVRTLIKKDFDDAFKQFDAIITPTSPTTAFKIGEKTSNPLSMYLSDIYTISANLAGIPAVSIPCGFSKDNLPIGLQIMTKPFDEQMLFRTAYSYEQNTDWHKKRVNL
ncbi:MAG: Asp-tRNA(Asn)/Glu-tRNA(Gln) amidotransferase subunit GatA [Candidatus Aceula meridiana]|nr:Asp-tRNA(Asn)/Glu-tRNA(Gln) amidotransferase subunit GatA [Candidatus Aceula meridiana]